jgi:hypothetical protein
MTMQKPTIASGQRESPRAIAKNGEPSGVTFNTRHPWFPAFFGFATGMCALTTGLLLFPRTALDA